MDRLLGISFSFRRWLPYSLVAFTMTLGPATQAGAQETAARNPGSAQVSEAAPQAGLLPEPRFLSKAIRLGSRFAGDGKTPRSGFFVETSTDVSGAGWLTLGPGYRQWLNNDSILIEGSGAWSWRSYKIADGRVEFGNLAGGHLAPGAEVRWQDLTQVTFFGEGPESLVDDRSEYRLKTVNTVGYLTYRSTDWLSITGRAGYLKPEIGAPTGTFMRGNPDTREVFGDNPVYSVEMQPAFLHGEVSITADTRDHRGHPTHGGLYRTAWSVYRDRADGLFDFDRYEAEALHVIPIADARWVLAFHAHTASTDVPDGSVVPFYLMPSLGGSASLRGFSDGRFHGRHMVLTTAEARMALFEHIDLAVFADAGNVADRYRDLDLDHRDYGLGIRLHTDRSTVLRLDAAHGPQGWRFVFKLNDPLHLKRLSRRTASVPFTP